MEMSEREMELSSSGTINPHNTPGSNDAAVVGDQGAILLQTMPFVQLQRRPPEQHSPSTAPPDQYPTTRSSGSGASTPLFAASPARVQSSGCGPVSSSPGPFITVTVHGEGQREKAFKSLKESIPHVMKMEQLQKSERHYQKKGSWEKKGVRRLSKELYQIVSWYALMHSALFAAVTQTSLLECEDWWAPILLSFLVTVGTLGGVVDKLWHMGKQQQEVDLFLARQNAVYANINELEWRGGTCDLDSLQPHHEHVTVRHPGVSPRAIFILGFLLGFSLLMGFSCHLILCNHVCKCASQ